MDEKNSWRSSRIEEERYKSDEEKILLGIKDRIEAQKKYKLDREKQEQIEKENQDKDEKRWKFYQKLGVEYHTQKEISLFSKEAMKLFEFPVKYDISPKTRSPFNSGKISKITIDNALKFMNALRYTAVLRHNKGVTEKYNKLAQMLLY